MKKKVKHHSLAHLTLMIILFVIAVVVFGGWTEGPLTSGLFLGAKAYDLVGGGAHGDLAATGAAAASLLQLAMIFVINLAIYYIISSALIFLFNMVFSRK